MKWIVVFGLCLGCGNKPAREVARDHREVSSCANDAETVKMYVKCEEQKSCAQYLDCLDGFKPTE